MSKYITIFILFFIISTNNNINIFASEYTNIKINEVNIENNNVNIYATVNNAVENQNITVMIAELLNNTVNYDSIVYINQFDNIAFNDSNFNINFKFDFDENKKYAFYLGGSNIDSPSVYYTRTENDKDILYGDADLNGVITANDSATVLKYILNKDNFTAENKFLKTADVDLTGTITANDASCIITKVLDSDYVFVAEQ